MEGLPEPSDTHFPEDWIGSSTRAVNKGREHFTEEGLSKVKLGGETMTLQSLYEKEPDFNAWITAYGKIWSQHPVFA